VHDNDDLADMGMLMLVFLRAEEGQRDEMMEAGVFRLW
jgi:hypothetical protein